MTTTAPPKQPELPAYIAGRIALALAFALPITIAIVMISSQLAPSLFVGYEAVFFILGGGAFSAIGCLIGIITVVVAHRGGLRLPTSGVWAIAIGLIPFAHSLFLIFISWFG